MNTPDSNRIPDRGPDRSTDRIADRISDRAAHIELGPPMLDVVVARGRQRDHRRRAAVGITAVVGICAGSIAAISVLSRPADPDRIAAAPTADSTAVTSAASTVPAPSVPAPSVPDGVAPSVDLVASPFVWNRVDPDSSEAINVSTGADSTIAGTGPFVAWSTAPAVSDDYSGVLWRSDDGLRWEQVAAPPPVTGRNVTAANGRFLTYGTSPATSAGRKSDLAIGMSDDGGRTWTTDRLPLDTSDLLAEAGVDSVGVWTTSIAATSDVVLVSAQITANIDLQSKLPAGTFDRPWTSSEAGIEVPEGDTCAEISPTTVSYGTGAPGTVGSDASASTIATACTYRTYTWADLGISARAARTWMHPEVRMLASTDGRTFTEIDPSGILDGATDVRLIALDDSFVASATLLESDGATVTMLFSSADGRAWTEIGVVPMTWTDSFGAVGERLVVTGYDNTASSQVVAVRDEAGTWSTTLLNGFVLPGDGVKASMGVGSIAVGPNGISMIGALFVDQVAEIGGVTLSKNGITVAMSDDSYNHQVIDDATGQVLATVTNDGDPVRSSSNPDLVVGTNGEDGPTFEVRREAGGEVVMTYTFEDLATAVATATRDQHVGPTVFLLHSVDGMSWSRESLDEIAGQPVTGTGGIRLTDSGVIVAANLAAERNPNGTPKQILLIATLAS